MVNALVLSALFLLYCKKCAYFLSYHPELPSAKHDINLHRGFVVNFVGEHAGVKIEQKGKPRNYIFQYNPPL